MDASYLMMLYVTLDQERALKQFFIEHGWIFSKPDLATTTDKIGPPGLPALQAVSQAENAAETPTASTSSVAVNQTLNVSPSVVRTSGRKRKLATVTRRSPPSNQPKQQKQLKSPVEAEDDDTVDTDLSNSELNKTAKLTFPITVECEDEEQVVVKLERADEPDLEHVPQTYQAIQTNQADDTNTRLDRETERHSDIGDNDDNDDDDVRDDISDNIVDDSLDTANHSDQPSAATSAIETVTDSKEDVLPVVPYQKQGSSMYDASQLNDAVSSILYDMQDIDQHTEAIQIHQCMICSKQYSKRANLTRHMKNHNPSSSYLCKACGKCFPRKDSLTQHEINVHFKNEGEPLLCSECGKECKNKKALHNHQRLHSNKRYQCDICAYTCSRRNTLERHKRSHTKQKFQCPNCLKMFMDVPSHLAVCRSELAESFECEFCGTCFKAMRYLTAHKGTVHGNRTYACSVCNEQFKHRATRLLHFNKFHRENKESDA